MYSGIYGFSYYVARLAQSVEHETLNLRVVGSSPTLGAQTFSKILFALTISFTLSLIKVVIILTWLLTILIMS